MCVTVPLLVDPVTGRLREIHARFLEATIPPLQSFNGRLPFNSLRILPLQQYR